MVRFVKSRFDAIDVLINNAAYRPKHASESMPVSEWEVMHAVITRGTFLCCREVIPIMRAQGGGSMVNIASVSAIHPSILCNVHYDSAKAGVEGLSRALAYEYAQHAIRVNVVRPGSTATEGGKITQPAGFTHSGPLSTKDRVPLGHRSAQPEQTARAILFLASPAASYITRQFLRLSGELTLRWRGDAGPFGAASLRFIVT